MKNKINEIEYYRSELAFLFDDEEELDFFMEDTVIPAMRLEAINIGSTGFAQVGSEDYYTKQNFEKEFLLKRIPELIGKLPIDATLSWKAFEHDFGTYHEMCLMMHSENKTHQNYLNKAEQIDFDKLEEEFEELWMQEQYPEDVSHLIDENKIP